VLWGLPATSIHRRNIGSNAMTHLTTENIITYLHDRAADAEKSTLRTGVIEKLHALANFATSDILILTGGTKQRADPKH
jgi:hypothetical protein